MLTYDPISDLQHHPTPMSRFGLNPYGGNRWRVVFAPSRRYLCCGTGADGMEQAKWLPLYRAIGPQWVLEGWRTAEEFAGCSREVWDANLSILGPWPERGEYQYAWTFDTASVDDTNIEKVLGWITAGRGYTFAEKIADAQKREAKELEAQRAMVRDRLANALPAFGIRPMFSARVARGTEHPNLQYSAEDLGLPTAHGSTQTKVGPKLELEIEQ